MNLTARINAVGYEKLVKQVDQITIRIVGKDYTFRYVFNHFDGKSRRFIQFKTIAISSKSNPFMNPRPQVFGQLKCLDAKLKKKAIVNVDLKIFSVGLGAGARYAFKGVCGDETKVRSLNLFTVDKKSVEIGVIFAATGPEDYFEQIEAITVRVLSDNFGYPFVLKKLNRQADGSQSKLDVRETFKVLRQFNPFKKRSIMVTSEFECEDEKFDKKNLTMKGFLSLQSKELDTSVTFVVQGTCGIERKALIIDEGGYFRG